MLLSASCTETGRQKGELKEGETTEDGNGQTKTTGFQHPVSLVGHSKAKRKRMNEREVGQKKRGRREEEESREGGKNK